MSKNENAVWKSEQQRAERRERLASQGQGGQKKRIRKHVPLYVWICLLAVLVALVAFAAYQFKESGIMVRRSIAFKMAGEPVSALEANYAMGSMLTGIYGSGIFSDRYINTLDDAFPFASDEQKDKTTREILLERFKESYPETVYLAKLAAEAGMSPDDAMREGIEAFFAQINSYAAQNDTTTGKLLIDLYGPGASPAAVKALMEKTALAVMYRDQLKAEYKFDETELEKAYGEHKDDLDQVNFMVQQFSINLNDYADQKKDAEGRDLAQAVEAMKKQAKDFLQKLDGTEENFKEQVKALNQENPAETKSAWAGKQELGEAYANYLFAPERQAGDSLVISEDGRETVLLFLKRERPEAKRYNVRHILVQVASDADEATKAEAKKRIESLEAAYKAGEQSAEAFAKLAMENTDDAASKENGGLYENVKKGSMIAPFENWALDPARKAGDVGIVEGQYGYHLMYFVSLGEEREWQLNAKSLLTEEAYKQYLEEHKDEMTVEELDLNYVLKR